MINIFLHRNNREHIKSVVFEQQESVKVDDLFLKEITNYIKDLIENNYTTIQEQISKRVESFKQSILNKMIKEFKKLYKSNIKDIDTLITDVVDKNIDDLEMQLDEFLNDKIDEFYKDIKEVMKPFENDKIDKQKTLISINDVLNKYLELKFTNNSDEIDKNIREFIQSLITLIIDKLDDYYKINFKDVKEYKSRNKFKQQIKTEIDDDKEKLNFDLINDFIKWCDNTIKIDVSNQVDIF